MKLKKHESKYLHISKRHIGVFFVSLFCYYVLISVWVVIINLLVYANGLIKPGVFWVIGLMTFLVISFVLLFTVPALINEIVKR